MRRSCLLLLLSTATIAGEAQRDPVPIIDLSYGGGVELREPAQGWWRESLAAAGSWWSQRSGTPIDAAQAARCPALRLRGVALTGADGELEPVAAGWWRDAPAPLAASLQAAIAQWPGHDARTTDGRLQLVARGIEAAGDAPPPGWRMLLHGVSLASEGRQHLVPLQGQDPAAIERAHALADAWRIEAALEPGGRSWLDLGLPARWLGEPDRDLVARLPAEARVAGAIAIDGAALERDLADFYGAHDAPWLTTLLGGVPLKPGEMAKAAHGTWIGAVVGRDGWMFAGPRGFAIDALIVALLRRERAQFAADGVITAVDDDCFVACDARWWVLADEAARIRSFLAGPAASPPLGGMPTGARGWIAADGGTCAEILRAQRHVVGAWRFALPYGLSGLDGRTETSARDLGLPLEANRFDALADAVAQGGTQSLTLGVRDGRILADLHGAVIGCIPIAFGLQWFADQARDLAGRARLRATMARLVADGAAAWPRDLLAGLPDPPAERLTALRSLLQDIGRVRPGWTGMARAEREALPLAQTPPGEALAQAKRLVAISAPLDDPATPSVETLVLRLAAADDRLGSMLLDTPHHAAMRTLIDAGRELVLHGDGDGVALVERGWRLIERPLSGLDLLQSAALRSRRDEAWLIAGLTGAVPRARMAEWLAEEWQADARSAWRAERCLMVGWMAAHWLRMPASPLQPGIAEVAGAGPAMRVSRIAPGCWTPAEMRGRTAEDLADLALLMRERELGRPMPAGWRPPRSPAVLAPIPVLTMTRIHEQRADLRRALLRLAWRIHLLASDGALPADTAALAAALGAEPTLPWGERRVAVRYERRSARGFRIVADPEDKALKLTERQRQALGVAPADLRLRIGQHEVVVDPSPHDAGEGR